MDKRRVTLAEILKAHEERKKKLARLPFEEKIHIVVLMQKRSAQMRPDLKRTIWQIEAISTPTKTAD